MGSTAQSRWSNKPGFSAAADQFAWTAGAVWRYARWPALGLLGLQLVVAVAPAASVRVTQHVINAGIAAAGQGPGALVRLLPWLAALAATLILRGAAAFQLSTPLSDRLAQRLRGGLGQLRLEKAARLPLLAFERSEVYDKLDRAGDGGAADVLFFSARHALGYGIELLTLSALFWPVAHWLPAVLLLGVVARSVRRAESSRRDLEFIEGKTEDRRRLDYLGRLLTGGDEQKELRVFNLYGPLAERWRGLRRSVRTELLDQKRRNTLFALPADGVSFAFTAGTAVLLALALAHHAITAGAFLALFGGARMVEGAGEQFAFQVAQGYSQVMGVGYLREFLALAEDGEVARDQAAVGDGEGAGAGRPAGTSAAPATGSAPPVGAAFPVPLREGIRCEHVTFIYPGREAPVLNGVDLHLRPGERVALVGENGCGKSTLAKCLLGLYRPDGGRITADGVDYRDITPKRLHAAVSAAYQDHFRFQFTLRASIGLGDVGAMDEDDRVRAAARRGGADEVAASLPGGYDTPLGRVLEGGSDLSGGQWQRVAVSRAFMRDAQLLVLDEPAAALDPQAEAALYRRFGEGCAGATVLLISHRLGSARLADRIVLLRGGRIAEDGTHAALLAAGGEYARMWEAQAQWYR